MTLFLRLLTLAAWGDQVHHHEQPIAQLPLLDRTYLDNIISLETLLTEIPILQSTRVKQDQGHRQLE
jgi:hypothetical protein